MSKYQNDTIGGSRTRTNRVIIETTLNSIPQVRFIEENVVLMADGSEISISKGRDIIFSYEPGKSFPVYNPETDEIIEGVTASHDDVFALFYSLIRSVQTEKDEEIVISRATVVAPVEPSPEPEV
jgi:hypothetical protein